MKKLFLTMCAMFVIALNANAQGLRNWMVKIDGGGYSAIMINTDDYDYSFSAEITLGRNLSDNAFVGISSGIWGLAGASVSENYIPMMGDFTYTFQTFGPYKAFSPYATIRAGVALCTVDETTFHGVTDKTPTFGVGELQAGIAYNLGYHTDLHAAVFGQRFLKLNDTQIGKFQTNIGVKVGINVSF